METSPLLAEPRIGTGALRILLTPHPHAGRACPGALGILIRDFICTWNINEENVFVELMPLLKDRTLLLTIARVGEKVKVNVIPAKAREGEDQALTTPLKLHGRTGGIGCGTWQTPCQLC